MNKLTTIIIIIFASIISIPNLVAQTPTLVIVDDDYNNMEITEVVYTINNQAVVQSTPSSNSNYVASDINIASIEIDDSINRTLTYMNSAQAVNNIEYNNQVLGVSIYEDGKDLYPNNNQANFALGVKKMTNDNDLLHMLRVDGASNLPQGYDYDMQLEYPMTEDNFIIIAERNGQSDLFLQALDANGNVILNANEIKIEPSYG